MMQTSTITSPPSTPVIENSSNAEYALSALADKYGHYLANLVSTMDLSVLKGHFNCADVCPIVKVDLLREKDRNRSKRTDLAQLIRDTMQTFLSENFTGNPKDSKLVLRVNVCVVSDGSHSYNERFSNMVGRGKAQGYGLSKLTVSYCLFSRVSGKVVVAKQLSRWEDQPPATANTTNSSKRRSNLVVLDLASDLHNKISREIEFVCDCFRAEEEEKQQGSNKVSNQPKSKKSSRSTTIISRDDGGDDTTSCASTCESDDDSSCCSGVSFFDS
jgi:hypothetical protein